MALKDLMVHLDGTERAGARLGMAAAIARRHGARLTGVFGRLAQPETVGIVAHWPPAEYAQVATRAQAVFAQATEGLAHARWMDCNRGGDTALLDAISAAARCADMVVLGQHDESIEAPVPAELPETVVTACGRPILVVPYAGLFGSEFKRPLIAWNASREAARALNDALPLISGCDEAMVLSLDPDYDAAKASCADLAAHLACHGITAKTDLLVVENAEIMDTVLSRAADYQADLLVMGAHGHLGRPFAGRATCTRQILRSMTLPVMMSH